MNDEEKIQNLKGKIQRENALLQAALAMFKQTDNADVRSRLETQMKETHRNIEFFNSKIDKLTEKTPIEALSDLSLHQDPSAPTPPAKDDDQDTPTTVVRKKPNFTKLDLIRYDTPYLGPRIQLMLTQLQFKLNVEDQYLKGIDKLFQLYTMDGDRKSKAEAAARRVESKQKQLLLKQALKRYEELYIDWDTDESGDAVNAPNTRKPVSGQLTIGIHAVKDVVHTPTSRFARTPETHVVVKVEDSVVVRTRGTRTDRWGDETHELDVEKANEIELTVYDKTGDTQMPIAFLWIRISDVLEALRKKRNEAELQNAGWVSADGVAGQPGGHASNPSQSSLPHFQPPPNASTYTPPPPPPGTMTAPPAAPVVIPTTVTDWFNLEPYGQIRLDVGFIKHQNNSRLLDPGLGRKGAVRQRKEMIHEMNGHKFVQHHFYNVMRCALCGDYLKYSAGMQCEDCKYLCHTKCYTSVVIKCISKSNADVDADEEKINHRIPHRFQPFSNMRAAWCCHCGYMLPFGNKKICRKCSECNLYAHSYCTHLVPDFCGMSMANANKILESIRVQKQRKQDKTPLSEKTLRPSSTKPSMATSSSSTLVSSDATEAARQTFQQQQHGHQQQLGLNTTAVTAASQAMGGASDYGNVPTSPVQPKYNPAMYAQVDTSVAGMYGGATVGQPQQQQQAGFYGFSQQPQPQASATANYYQQQAATPAQQQAAYSQYAQPGYYGSQPQIPSSTSSASVIQQGGYAQGQPQPQHAQKTAAPATAPAPGHQQGAPSHGSAMSISSSKPQLQPVQDGTAVAQRKPLPSASDPGTGMRIGLDHFNFLAVLGKGNFGKVMLAESKRARRLYAIKVLKKEFIIENDEAGSLRSEKRVFLIANRERHPFLTNLHACFQTETRVYFVMEYVSGGDLMLHIQRGQFGTKRAQFYAAEVCLALKYFHENGVIYRDLKLDNILLTLDGHIKIADYGLCKEDMWYGTTTSTFCGTPEFMAPEILQDKRYGRAVDWWAFGVLIYQMLLQQSPFRGEDEEEIYDAILTDEPLYPIHMPRDSVSILQKLLTREPDQRLGSGPTDAQEVMSQPFFRNINWDDIYHKRMEPPFLPSIKNETDTSNFDSEFTSVTPVLTPVQSILSQKMQEEFRGFSYTFDFQ